MGKTKEMVRSKMKRALFNLFALLILVTFVSAQAANRPNEIAENSTIQQPIILNATEYIFEHGNLTIAENVTAANLFSNLNASYVQNPPWLLSADSQPYWVIVNGNTTSNITLNNGNVHISGRLSMNTSQASGRNSVALGANGRAIGNGSVVSGGGTYWSGTSFLTGINTASGEASVVSGGFRNTASGRYSAVSSGYVNTASGFMGVVTGGDHNTASGFISTVNSGGSNLASGSYSYVGGGVSNTASGYDSTVAGGRANIASGFTASVLGGFKANATGNFSFAAGYNLQAGLGVSNRTLVTFAFGNNFTNDQNYSFMVGFYTPMLVVNQSGVYANGSLINITGIEGNATDQDIRLISLENKTYWVDLNGYITSNSSYNNGNVNVSNNLSVRDTLFVNRTINPVGNYLAYNNQGYTKYLNEYGTGSPTGQQQFMSNWTPTTGSGASHIGNLFSSYVNTTGITWSAPAAIVGTKFDSIIYAPKNFAPFPTLTMIGTIYNASIIGGYVSGAQFWSGGITGVQSDVNIQGAWSSVAGANFYPIVYNVNFNASASLSHQVSGLNMRTNYNANNSVNQVYGFQSSANAGAGARVGGNLNAIFGSLGISPDVTLSSSPSIYQAYVSSSDGPTYDASLAAGKKFIAYYIYDAVQGFVMPNHDTVGFYSTLRLNNTNYAFQSDGASGWMNKNGSMWMFGTNKGFNISFDGTGTIAGNTALIGNLNVTGDVNSTNNICDGNGNCISANSYVNITALQANVTDLWTNASNQDGRIGTLEAASTTHNDAITILQANVTDFRTYFKWNTTAAWIEFP